MRAKIFLAISIILIGMFSYIKVKSNSLPLIAIANYGPHSSLADSIEGIKTELAANGFHHNQNIKITMADVGFDLTLIPQMLTKLKNQKPTVLVVVGTPITQFAKNAIKEIPLVFNVVTDPVAVGILKEANLPECNITGASDKQDPDVVLTMIKKLIPHAKTVGMLYATSEANDIALISMFKEAASKHNLQILAVPVDNTREVPLKMQIFKHKAEVIYVGSSGAIQPTLPAIANEADRMGIPIINVNEEAVRSHLALASFGVNYYQVGKNTGKLIAGLLNGLPFNALTPIFPTAEAHQGFISKLQANKYQLEIPSDLANVTVVE